jgi:hypothetical protein
MTTVAILDCGVGVQGLNLLYERMNGVSWWMEQDFMWCFTILFETARRYREGQSLCTERIG